MRASVALTERFIEVMEREHRELGLGDPTLGKTVRKLVGALARRVELWRGAVAASDWDRSRARQRLRRRAAGRGAVRISAAALRELWSRLEQTDRSTRSTEGRIA